jgi:hypothetical protein
VPTVPIVPEVLVPEVLKAAKVPNVLRC